jgi:hypothetical protein
MWDDRKRDGRTNSTLRIKEQEKRLTLNEHDDDEDIQQDNLRTLSVPRIFYCSTVRLYLNYDSLICWNKYFSSKRVF